MEKKYIKVPFDVEMAKKVTEKSVEGRIVTRCGFTARVICWDRFGRDNPLVVLLNNEKDEVVICYNNDGVFSTEKKEDGLDLMLEIPEYTTFKDGDIIAYDDCDAMAIIKAEFFKNDSGDICSKSYITILDEKNLQQFSVLMNGARLATEEEKQKFVNILKASKELKAKIILKKFFGINPKQLYEFKPFDKVLVRDGNDGCWHADIFSHKNKDRGRYYCTGYEWRQCIPYNDQTAHLLGTTDNWEEIV